MVQDHFPGIGRYAWNLVQHLPAQLHADEFLTVLWDPDAQNTRLPIVDNAANAHARVRFLPLRRSIFDPRNLLQPLPVLRATETRHSLELCREYSNRISLMVLQPRFRNPSVRGTGTSV